MQKATDVGGGGYRQTLDKLDSATAVSRRRAALLSSFPGQMGQNVPELTTAAAARGTALCHYTY